jgi:hypothetical protein
MDHGEVAPWLLWLENSGLGLAMRQWLWLYPITEILHLVGIATLVGSAAMFDLRLLGVSRRLPVSAMASHLLPWAWRGMALVALSGGMMFVAHAGEWATNPVFWAKMTLIGLAGLNALVFHQGIFKSVAGWDGNAEPPRAARVAGVASLVFWVCVISAGRLLAYL